MSLSLIAETGLVAITRGTEEEYLIPVVEALAEGGCKAVEVTCNTPGAIEMISKLRDSFGKELLIGAGTVLDRETARLAILAGAQYILMPHFSKEVVEIGNLYGKDVIPGVMSPTEITQALQLGVKMVKVFPASTLGAEYFSNILGPYSNLQMMAVGGINLKNAADFLRAGAIALGIGSDLVNNKIVQDGRYNEIKRKTEQYLKIIREVRKGGDG